MQLKKTKIEKTLAGKLDIDNFYCQLCLLERMTPFVRVFPLYLAKARHILAVFEDCSNELVSPNEIYEATNGEFLFSEVSLSGKAKIIEGNLQTNLKYCSGRYIDESLCLAHIGEK